MANSTGHGLRVRELRQAFGLSQERLAHRVGVTRNTVVRWERDGGIDGRHLVALADVLGVSARWILTGEEDGS